MSPTTTITLDSLNVKLIGAHRGGSPPTETGPAHLTSRERGNLDHPFPSCSKLKVLIPLDVLQGGEGSGVRQDFPEESCRSDS